LNRLLEQGWIVRWDDDLKGATSKETPGRPRKTYTLTRVGWRVLESEIDRLQAVVAAATPRLVGAS
jgi:DNA-binding PadR family transcriptional regulator